MKKYLLLIFAPLSLNGCASTQAVLSKEPTQVYHSDHSVNEVAFCLANKNNTSALDKDDGSKVVLLKNGYGGVSLAFTIYPEPPGSRIEYRQEFGTIGGVWKKCVGVEPWKG
ncbi:MAG: hypothetical protein ABI395_12895 [Sphingobium sp.]